MGVLGALVAEADGGLGFNELDVVLLAEESGRAALPEPFIEHVLIGAPLVPSETVVTGAATVTAGETLVPYAAAADLLLIGGDDAFVVSADKVDVEPRESVDGSRRLGFVDAGPSDAIRELTADENHLAFDRGALGTAAQLVGLGQHLLDETVEYVTNRRQFGVPIGSFQALKHKLADVRIALEFARPLVYRAANSLATNDPESSVHVSMAKAQASDAAELAARHALQCHGAIGYSYEHDLHLWMKRVWVLARAWGDAPLHRERVARAIL
jgi:alkylation response protein AidB-like acyl-CoA dehydrogenase